MTRKTRKPIKSAAGKKTTPTVPPYYQPQPYLVPGTPGFAKGGIIKASPKKAAPRGGTRGRGKKR